MLSTAKGNIITTGILGVAMIATAMLIYFGNDSTASSYPLVAGVALLVVEAVYFAFRKHVAMERDALYRLRSNAVFYSTWVSIALVAIFAGILDLFGIEPMVLLPILLLTFGTMFFAYSVIFLVIWKMPKSKGVLGK